MLKRIAQFDSLIATVKSRLGLERLAVREKLILIAGGLLVVVVLVYQLIISPYNDARKKLLNSIEKKKEELTEIQQLKQQYADLRLEEGGIKVRLAKRTPGFTLFAFLDKQAENANVKPQINYMKPSIIAGEGEAPDESIVELKLEGITLERLVDFLQRTESEENVVSIRRLSIQTSSRDEGYLDVILQIVTLVGGG